MRLLSARLRVITLSSRVTSFQYSEIISKGLWEDQVLNEKGGQQEEGGSSPQFRMKIEGA